MDEETLEGGRFFMKTHYSKENWLQYINGELSSQLMSEMEEHLYSCDQCLFHYLELIAKTDLPAMTNESIFTEKVMQEIEKIPVQSKKVEENQLRKTKQGKYFKQTVIHYLLAAGLTIVLVSTGFFGKILESADQFQKDTVYNPSTSITEQLFNKTEQFVHLFIKNDKEAR